MFLPYNKMGLSICENRISYIVKETQLLLVERASLSSKRNDVLSLFLKLSLHLSILYIYSL
jgi:hypothetical protein